MRRGADGIAGSLVSLAGAFLVVGAVALATGQVGEADPGALLPYLLVGLLVPGLSQYAFVGSVRLAGPARTGVLIGLAPLVSAVVAIAFLDEPFRVPLLVGTLLVVLGCASLAWEGQRPEGFHRLGILLGAACAVLFAVRDNLVRAASDGTAGPLAAAAASLLGGLLALGISQAVLRRGELIPALRRSFVPFLPGIATLLVAYTCLVEALARGKVTVVSPLNAMQSLWSVLLTVWLVGASERVGPRLWAAGVLVVAGGAIVAATR